MKRKVVFLTFKVLPFFLLDFLILSSLLISGCSPLDLILGPSTGSIYVETYPSGAKIFLDGKDTGEITPCTIINLIKGDHKITLTFGDKSYTEEITIFPDSTASIYKDLLPRLKEIIVDPNFLYTNIGETRNFSTITAYYFDIDHIPVVIKLSDCGFTKDNGHAIINSGAGTFTGVSKGLIEVTIFYTEREFTKSDIVYISVGTFPIPSPEPEPDEILQASIIIVSWEQSGDFVTIYYEIENTGNVDIDFYEIWFDIKCIDNSEYIGWDADWDVKVDEKKMGFCMKVIEKTVKSVSVRSLDLTNYDL
ncbi:unnamed protein product [marine sediment metagenome]|uniref:PEGA domain-containing protein n=1 Tax=marine sediment metagenome TaxID=412755 RepID=X1GPM6_9ZZZZ